MPRGFAGETVAQESRGRTSPSRSSVSRGRSSASYASRSPGRGVSAQTGASSAASQQAVREVQQREERARSSMANVPSALTGLMLGLGSAMRSEIVRQIEAGGTPVRENGMVIGVMTNGRYTGRQREADRLANQQSNRDDRQAATGATPGTTPPAAPPADEPPAGPPVVRRSKLAQQIEEENRRRRLAGMRRLGSRTLLSGDRFTSDTLGVS
jgi:pyruvate/2-oxoglutarate dehydrogenase complex dihydrolipoamide acyltransferase (E2) component